MQYRYGDATPFPIEDNFIETIVAAVDACVALFEADVAAEERRRKAKSVRDLAAAELRRIEILEHALEAALAPLVPEGKPTRTAEATATRIAGTARREVQKAKGAVARRREIAVRAAMGDAISARVEDAVAELLAEHQLPKTRWSTCWNGGTQDGAARMNAECRAAAGISARFAVDIPNSNRWSGPVRAGDLETGLVLHTQGKPRLFRSKRRIVKTSLDKYFITEVEITHQRAAFVLRRKLKKPSAGYRIVMRAEDVSTPRLQPIDAKGDKRGNPLSLSGESALALSQLWKHIEGAMFRLVRHRGEMTSARLRETPVAKLDEPAEIAEAILQSLAPLVREMRLRSRVPGELVLKRDLGDGRREELFVPRRQLEQAYAILPPHHRACFAAVGLGGEATREFVTREFPLEPPAASPPPIPAPMKRAHRLATQPDAAA